MLVLAATTGVQHDFGAYLQQWQIVLDGADPWSTTNAYGPLHNLFAFLLPLGPLGPKLAIVLPFVVGVALLAARLKPVPGSALILIVTILANALVIGMGVIYGLNDAFVAALMIGAVLCRFDRRPILAGVLLGLAGLEKFYPILLALAFALEGRRVNRQVIIAALGTFAAGMVAAYAVWGGTIFTPMTFGTARGVNLLSFLSSLSSTLGDDNRIVYFLTRWNTVFVVAAVSAATAIAWWRRWHWLEAAAVALLLMLVTYKVGHQQFYISWLVLVAALPLVGTSRARALAVASLPIAVFLSLFQFGYQFASDGYRTELLWARTFGGYVAFGLAATALVIWLTQQARQRRLSSQGLAEWSQPRGG